MSVPKRTGVKAIREGQGRLDRQRIHGDESSVAFSRFIGVESDSEVSIMSTCIEH